jgi:hypothetical protein
MPKTDMPCGVLRLLVQHCRCWHVSRAELVEIWRTAGNNVPQPQCRHCHVAWQYAFWCTRLEAEEPTGMWFARKGVVVGCGDVQVHYATACVLHSSCWLTAAASVVALVARQSEVHGLG